MHLTTLEANGVATYGSVIIQHEMSRFPEKKLLFHATTRPAIQRALVVVAHTGDRDRLSALPDHRSG